MKAAASVIGLCVVATMAAGCEGWCQPEAVPPPDGGTDDAQLSALVESNRNVNLGPYSCVEASSGWTYYWTMKIGVGWWHVTWTASHDWMTLDLWQPIPYREPYDPSMALVSSKGGLGGPISMHINPDGSYSNAQETNLWLIRQSTNTFMPGWFVVPVGGIWISPPNTPDASHPNGMIVFWMAPSPQTPAPGSSCSQGIPQQVVNFVAYL